MIVYKFGGATTRTKAGIDAMTAIVRHALTGQNRLRLGKTKSNVPGVVVVVSAIGHTTRNLASAAELAKKNELKSATQIVGRIAEEHLALAAIQKLPHDSLLEFEASIRSIQRETDSYLGGIALTGECSLRTRDLLLGMGERFAAALIQALFLASNIPVVYVPSSEVIITDGNFGSAAPLYDEIEKRAKAKILPQISKGKVVLTEGFTGATRESIATTMGSESSDLTATLLGAALKASEVVIWKSVGGIFKADPEHVPSAKLLKNLTFAESDEIGLRGARVLFKNVAEPLMRSNGEIPLRIAAPKISIARSERMTTIERNPSKILVHAVPLALSLDGNLQRVVIQLKNADGEKTMDAQTRKELQSQFEDIQSRAPYVFRSGNTFTMYVKCDALAELESIVRKLDADIVDSTPIAALSVILRLGSRPGRDTQSDIAEIRTRILQSIKRFHPLAFFGEGQSTISILEEPLGIKALKKLHQDLFER